MPKRFTIWYAGAWRRESGSAAFEESDCGSVENWTLLRREGRDLSTGRDLQMSMTVALTVESHAEQAALFIWGMMTTMKKSLMYSGGVLECSEVFCHVTLAHFCGAVGVLTHGASWAGTPLPLFSLCRPSSLFRGHCSPARPDLLSLTAQCRGSLSPRASCQRHHQRPSKHRLSRAVPLRRRELSGSSGTE